MSFEKALAQFDRGFRPEETKGLAALPEGDYTFAIVDTRTALVKNKTTPIFSVTLRVEAGQFQGQLIEHAFVLTSIFTVNRLGAFLARLGLDVENWTEQKGRPCSKEIEK